jgi:hypothetical protein
VQGRLFLFVEPANAAQRRDITHDLLTPALYRAFGFE